MRVYKEVVFSKAVLFDLGEIRDFIVFNNTHEAANKYIDQLEAEINALVYLADCFPISRWLSVRRYHPEARSLITRNKKWNVVFHTDGDLVIVDKIIPSKMVIH